MQSLDPVCDSSAKAVGTLANSIKEHMQSYTDVRWQLIGQEGKGCVQLQNYPWAALDVYRLCVAPVFVGMSTLRSLCSSLHIFIPISNSATMFGLGI